MGTVKRAALAYAATTMAEAMMAVLFDVGCACWGNHVVICESRRSCALLVVLLCRSVLKRLRSGPLLVLRL
jgi:hypothetical protein